MTRAVAYLRVSTAKQAEKDLTEEGYSIPAQREACARHVIEQGWTLVDEYSDRGESARSADRPQLQAMLARIAEDGDVDAVIVHKVDRLARNMDDHVAIRALLRRHNVTLVSVSENLEETASGRLVEGIHALMAEFYSANLATEIRKGLAQKAKMGGWPPLAPLGYLNSRDTVGGRQVATINPDPERAHLVTAAFQLYATGDWSLERLAAELASRGLRSRPRRDGPGRPVAVSGVARMLANKGYIGLVEWNGVESRGHHDPLIDTATFDRVQHLLAARAVRGTRDRRHHHYLKGLLHCGVCDRRLSCTLAKGTYLYFYCLGQKTRKPTGCREPFIPADKLERAVADLYQRVQLPTAWHDRLVADLNTEVVARQDRNAAERQFLTRKLTLLEGERRKLLEAYYAGAVDIATLKTEQDRIGGDARTLQHRLDGVDAHLQQWQDILATAARYATDCARTYTRADEPTRRLLNAAVIRRLDIVDGQIARIHWHPPFDTLFNGPQLEYGNQVVGGGFEPP